MTTYLYLAPNTTLPFNMDITEKRQNATYDDVRGFCVKNLETFVDVC